MSASLSALVLDEEKYYQVSTLGHSSTRKHGYIDGNKGGKKGNSWQKEKRKKESKRNPWSINDVIIKITTLACGWSLKLCNMTRNTERNHVTLEVWILQKEVYIYEQLQAYHSAANSA